MPKKFINFLRKRLYNNITPRTYYKPEERVFDAIVLNKKDTDKYGDVINAPTHKDTSEQLDDIWATYLNIPKTQRKKISNKNKLVSNNDGTYSLGYIGTIYDDVMRNGLGYDDYIDYKGSGNLHHFYQTPMKLGENRWLSAGDVFLGDYNIKRGYDENGEYMEYSDVWDINPYKRTHSDYLVGNDINLYGQKIKNSWKNKLLGNINDASFGIGTPINIKGKFYLDDYYGVPKRTNSTYLPEVTITGRRRLESRGKLTK